MTRPRSRTTTRSASAPTNCMSCSTRTIVRPRCDRSCSASIRCAFSPARSPAAGSSSKSSDGCCASARAMASSRSCPSGRTAAGSDARPSSPTVSRARRASSQTRFCSRRCQGGRSMLSTKPERERTCAPTAALSRTLSSLSGRVVWKTVASPCCARRWGLSGHVRPRRARSPRLRQGIPRCTRGASTCRRRSVR